MIDVPELPDNTRTVAEIVAWCARRLEEGGVFFGHGTCGAWDEAAAIAAYALRVKPGEQELQQDQVPNKEERSMVADILVRRINSRKPLAYLTHEAWFAGLRFHVDERVLVPRSPLAEVIEAGFAPWIDPLHVDRILDIGTGSGCIAVASALACPHAQVDAVDISSGALEVAAANVRDYDLAARVRTLQSDLFTGLAGCSYDVIVSNPPYVKVAEMESLPEEYRHEPAMGLAAGESGLDVVIRILQQARDYLRTGGILLVEVGDRREELGARFPGLPFLWLEFEQGGEGVFLLNAAQLPEDGCASHVSCSSLYPHRME